MKVGSLVELVRPQDPRGHRLCPVYMGVIYTVSCVCHGNFTNNPDAPLSQWQPAIYLEETGNLYAFNRAYFREVQPPMDVTQLLEQDLQKV